MVLRVLIKLVIAMHHLKQVGTELNLCLTIEGAYKLNKVSTRISVSQNLAPLFEVVLDELSVCQLGRN